MKTFLRIAYVLIAIFLAYNIWSKLGRDYTYSCNYRAETLSFGPNSGHGNILGIQPWFSPFDFSRPSAFYNIIEYHLSLAQKKGMLNAKTIVVLPEYVGTWLVVAGEKRGVFTEKEMEPAMRTLVYSNIGGFVWHYLQSQSEDKAKEAVFRMKALHMKNIYEKTFSTLSKKYGVTIVAGSIVLPGPNLVDGQLRSDKQGKLYNVSCVFMPDGKIQAPLVIKQFPIKEEKTFTACTEDTTPVFQTPAGKLAVLICADSWYPQAYKNLEEADIVVSPSFVSPAGSWEKPWAGYSGAPAPADIDISDVGRIDEAAAWQKYSMAARAPVSGIRYGIQVFLHGDFWDLGSDGHAQVVAGDSTCEVESAQLINLWLAE